MSYVIFNPSNGRITNQYYASERGAKIALTRLKKKDSNFDCYQVGDYLLAKMTSTKVTKVNLMTGEEYQEDINTPLCCSPSSETYWSL